MSKALNLSHDEFFRALTDLFTRTSSKEHGTVLLTQKRLTYDASNPSPPNDIEADRALSGTTGPLLIRATNAASSKNRDSRKIKLSTVVEAGDIDTFYVRYAEVCKTGMSALKKRDRKKRKKTKATKTTT